MEKFCVLKLHTQKHPQRMRDYVFLSVYVSLSVTWMKKAPFQRLRDMRCRMPVVCQMLRVRKEQNVPDEKRDHMYNMYLVKIHYNQDNM